MVCCLHKLELVQQNQFIDNYTNLGYLEAIALNLLEIVKFKIKMLNSRQG